jgi:hypothetical protein
MTYNEAMLKVLGGELHGFRWETRRLLLPGRRSCRRLVRAGTTENPDKAVITLVTRVFIDRKLPLRHSNLRRPGPGPRRRVIDREFVQQRVRADARETFNQLH